MKCPLCSNSVLRHIEHGEVSWFCHHCWQTIPDLGRLLPPKHLSKNLNKEKWLPSKILQIKIKPDSVTGEPTRQVETPRAL